MAIIGSIIITIHYCYVYYEWTTLLACVECSVLVVYTSGMLSVHSFQSLHTKTHTEVLMSSLGPHTTTEVGREIWLPWWRCYSVCEWLLPLWLALNNGHDRRRQLLTCKWGESAPKVIQGCRKDNVSDMALRRCVCAIVFSRDSPYKVHMEAALLERQEQHPIIFFQILKNSYWLKKWYGHGRTGCHGSDAPIISEA